MLFIQNWKISFFIDHNCETELERQDELCKLFLIFSTFLVLNHFKI